ncbi:MAG: Na/Pi symporter [Gammaproteobacteria bacterium]|nr:Na/Pi symporter [Gammaproteobacteria bacterium]
MRRIVLATIFAILAYGFWISPDFKTISAGVAVFLFGMLSLEEGFRAFTGGVLEQLLRRTTDRLWKSLVFGVVSTTLMQSSSLVSVITISFLSAGLLDLAAGIGIIFGANLGTTTGAWLVAGLGLKVDIAAYAMPMLVFGVILVFQKAKPLKGAGYILAGLGFLFLGIAFMKDGFEAFKETLDLSQFALPGLVGLLVYTLVGILATVVMQSSHATLVITITALAAGQVTYENALALAIGSNVGTTITAILGALSANVEGKRLAGAHLLFNVTTGLLAIVLIGPFAAAVDAISAGIGIADDDYTLKLAVFHTLFNLVGIAVMLPLLGRLVQALEHLLRAKAKHISEPRHLTDSARDFPDTAVEAVRKETLHIYENSRDVIAAGLYLRPSDLASDMPLDEIVSAPVHGNPPDIQEAYETRVKPLYNAVVAFISQSASGWGQRQMADLHWLRNANRNLVEAIKATKHLQKNLAVYVRSDNPYIRDEYNRLRMQVATVLRALEQARSDDEDADVAILALDGIRAALERGDEAFTDRLYGLIRERRITPQMGTSLMNDTGYAHDIQRDLIAMAQTLFAGPEHELAPAQRKLQLDEDEIAEALDKSRAIIEPEKPSGDAHGA